MSQHRITRSTALGLALAALAASTAVAQQDLRSPDTRDAATAVEIGQDLRSPDTRDAARSATAAAQQQDLRSPDTRDAARSATAAAPLAHPQPLKDYGKNAATGDYEPLARPQSPAPSDDTPWLPIALAITGTLVIVAASATQLRRLRVRRRRAVRSTA